MRSSYDGTGDDGRRSGWGESEEAGSGGFGSEEGHGDEGEEREEWRFIYSRREAGLKIKLLAGGEDPVGEVNWIQEGAQTEGGNLGSSFGGRGFSGLRNRSGVVVSLLLRFFPQFVRQEDSANKPQPNITPLFFPSLIASTSSSPSYLGIYYIALRFKRKGRYNLFLLEGRE